MRVLLLTQYFAPEPASMFNDLARMLSERGHTVQVITGFPCYPHGRMYSGYHQRFYAEEELNGATVTRVPQYPDHSRSAWRRAVYYLSFALAAATIGLWRARKCDVILVYQSAMPIGLAAWLISRVKRVPYVLDVVDLWPESVAASGMLRSRALMSVIRACMRFIYRRAVRINVITEGYRENLLALGVDPKKISLIHCWPADQLKQVNDDARELRVARPERAWRVPSGHVATPFAKPHGVPPIKAPISEHPQLSNNQFNVVYTGMMGPVQDLQVVIEAARLLNDFPGVQFTMVGDGVEHQQLVERAAILGVNNVCFLGRRSPEACQQLMATSDALLVHLKPDPVSTLSIPSKTFSYLAAGRPILMGVEGEATRLIEQHRCGLAFEPSNPQALAAAVRELACASSVERQQMAEASHAAFLENFRPDLQMRKFERLLADVVSQHSESLLQAA
jgi:glycosyltransferase involved in cell wall biosynthesis